MRPQAAGDLPHSGRFEMLDRRPQMTEPSDFGRAVCCAGDRRGRRYAIARGIALPAALGQEPFHGVDLVFHLLADTFRFVGGRILHLRGHPPQPFQLLFETLDDAIASCAVGSLCLRFSRALTAATLTLVGRRPVGCSR